MEALAQAVHDLERQLHNAESHFADTMLAVDKAREEWRELSVDPGVQPAMVCAAKCKFEAVAARYIRLRQVIDDLEEKLDT